jgi:hypothetical protein
MTDYDDKIKDYRELDYEEYKKKYPTIVNNGNVNELIKRLNDEKTSHNNSISRTNELLASINLKLTVIVFVFIFIPLAFAILFDR